MNRYQILTAILQLFQSVYGETVSTQYPLQCPSASQWQLRAKAICNESFPTYYCILDQNVLNYNEWCDQKGDIQTAGYKFVLRGGGLDGEICDDDRFQPYGFRSEGNSDCVFHKSTCSEEGQVLYYSGSMFEDVSCRCDNTRGFAFVQLPHSGCSCNPHYEECSCYLKQCKFNWILSNDYKCISSDAFEHETSCEDIQKFNNDGNDTGPFVISETFVKDQYIDYNNKAALVHVCFVSFFIGFPISLLVVLTRLQRWLRGRENMRLHERTMFEWQLRDKDFQKNQVTHRLMERVKNESVITVVGSSGFGKSIAVRHVALNLCATYNYEIVCCSIPDEIELYLKKKNRKILIFDDIMEHHSGTNILHKFNQTLEKNRERLESSEVKIVLVLPDDEFRKSTLNQTSVLLKSKFSMTTDGIPSKCEFEYGQTNAEMYFTNEELKIMGIKRNDDRYTLFLSLFPLYKRKNTETRLNNIKKFFTDPEKAIYDDLRLEMQKKNPSTFVCLVLFVIYNNSIAQRLLCDNSELLFTLSEIKSRFKEKKVLTLHMIRSKIDYLCHSYVTRFNNRYIIASENLFRILLNFCEENLLDVIIEIAQPEAFRDLLRLKSVIRETEFVNDNSSCFIIIKEKYESLYYKRLCKDITDEHTLQVFTNRQFQSSLFCKTVTHCLKDDEKVIFSVTKMSNSERSPLLIISEYGYDKMINYFSGLKLDQNVRNSFGATPIFLAACNGHIESVKVLLDLGSDVNICTNKGETAIYIAACKGHSAIVELLINKTKSMINVCTVEGNSPLYAAANNGFTNIVELLLKNGAYPDSKCYQKRTPLYVACLEGYCPVVDLLIEKGADVNLCNVAGQSPLHAAVERGHYNIVEKLLNSNCSIDIFDKWRFTPLLVAIQEGHTTIARLMMQKSANPNISTYEGESPLLLSSKN